MASLEVPLRNTTVEVSNKLEFEHGQVDGGLRSHGSSGQGAILGSMGFIWLLTLRPSQWKTMHCSVTIPGEFRDQIQKHWEGRLVSTGHNLQAIDIEFSAGTAKEAQEWVRKEEKPNGIRIFRVTTRTRRITIDHTRYQSLVLPHETVGGVTDHKAKFYLDGCPKIHITPTVRRTVGSIIDHKRYIAASTSPAEYITITDLLPTNNVSVNIQLPCRYTESGMGYRRLGGQELGLAWDLPLWSLTGRITTNLIKSLVPLKAGLVIADSIMAIQIPRGNHLGERPLPSLRTQTMDSRGHYIKSINTWLPPTWIDESLITGKAAKIDSAAVPVHLWNQRISLTLQCPVNPLNCLRRFFHRQLCNNVIRSFFLYMIQKHSPWWMNWLQLTINKLSFPWFFEAMRQALVHFVRSATRRRGGGDNSKPEGHNSKPEDHVTAVTNTLNYVTSVTNTANSTQRTNARVGLREAEILLANAITFTSPTTRQTDASFKSARRAKLVPPQKRITLRLGGKPGGEVWIDNNSSPHQLKLREFTRDLVLGQEACLQYYKSTWWKWDNGSSLLFWRWPTEQSIAAARDGFPLFIRDKLPRYNAKQRPLTKEMASQIADKIADVIKKTYVSPVQNPVSYIDYFGVPKGEGPNGEILDIRIVYNGTSCGLNDAVWAPNFWLPNADTAIRQMNFGYWVMDLDLGEMFLNFPVPEIVRPYLCIPVNGIRKELTQKRVNNHPNQVIGWNRLLMGFKPSPFFAIKFFYHAEEFLIGDRLEPSNPFRFDRVILNLPGMRSFDPRQPWVMKWDNRRNCPTAAIVTFVDDLRASGSSSEHVWQAAQQVAKRLQYLGIQHAPRKLRPPSWEKTGAWAGGITEADEDHIFKSITQAKWDRISRILDRIELELKSSQDQTLDFKGLEKDRGFLVHVAMTYKIINPYLKGFHQTIDSWRPNRDKEGWKLKQRDWLDRLAAVGDDNIRQKMIEAHSKGHPTRVKAVPRLATDLKALQTFFKGQTPTKVSMRAKAIFQVNFGFGDASGNGFGDNWLSTAGISYHHGTWCTEVATQSSNYREFRNVLDSIKREGEAGRLREAFFIFATDNTTVEAALFKGTADSPKLLEMVIEFNALQMKYGFEAIVTHVAGFRMIKQGGDGLSRGALNEGVMNGEAYRSFIPFHLSPTQREPLLRGLITRVLGPSLNPIYLSPEDWYERGHDIIGGAIGGDGFWRPTVSPGVYVWDLPPSSCHVALEELRKARIKRQESTHIVLCPRLMTPLWMKQLLKCCDLVVEIPPVCTYWSTNMFEPCILGICFPYLRSDPWVLRGTPKMFQLRRHLCKMWKEDQVGPINILHEFLLVSRRLPKMSRDMVLKLLYFQQ